MTVADSSDLTALFGLLQHPRRRYTLYYLTSEATRADLDTLATHVATQESDDTESEPSSETVDAICVSLHHKHLPKLSDADFVRYDADTACVERLSTPLADQVIEQAAKLEGTPLDEQ